MNCAIQKIEFKLRLNINKIDFYRVRIRMGKGFGNIIAYFLC